MAVNRICTLFSYITTKAIASKDIIFIPTVIFLTPLIHHSLFPSFFQTPHPVPAGLPQSLSGNGTVSPRDRFAPSLYFAEYGRADTFANQCIMQDLLLILFQIAIAIFFHSLLRITFHSFRTAIPIFLSVILVCSCWLCKTHCLP